MYERGIADFYGYPFDWIELQLVNSVVPLMICGVVVFIALMLLGIADNNFLRAIPEGALLRRIKTLLIMLILGTILFLMEQAESLGGSTFLPVFATSLVIFILSFFITPLLLQSSDGTKLSYAEKLQLDEDRDKGKVAAGNEDIVGRLVHLLPIPLACLYSARFCCA